MDRTALHAKPMQPQQRCHGLLHRELQTHLRPVVLTMHRAATLVQISRQLVAEFCLQFHDHGRH